MYENKDDEKFSYAHNDTSIPERVSRTHMLNKLNLPPEVQEIRENAFARNIPVSSDETLAFLRICAAAANPEAVLEIGTAVGVSGICMLDICPSAHLTTIEKNEDFASEAEKNFAALHMSDRATVIRGDAGEILPTLTGEYGFIFLDGAKVQYIKYLPDLVRLLKKGGVLFADDVLLYGWVNGENPVPQKRRMLVKHIKEYIEAASSSPELETTVIDVGDGVALSVKK